ncbi:MAG: hypothetical protein H7293_11025 [Candidatus Saccharibacteria bacterium]|nr:hypothetical protein [Rhodoferax sp.]
MPHEELGLPTAVCARASLMGAWDHFYSDSAFDPNVSTHYVNLPHGLLISPEEQVLLQLPAGRLEQHARWQWLGRTLAVTDESVHPYARIYAQWCPDHPM